MIELLKDPEKNKITEQSFIRCLFPRDGKNTKAKDILDLLVTAGIDISKYDNILIIAVKNNYDIEVIEALIKAGANINATDGKGKTPLHYANGDADLTKVLIAAGVDISAKDDEGKTPIFYANSSEAVNALIKAGAGADPHIKDTKGKGPLFSVYKIDGIKALIENGSNINDQDPEGKTPLHYAYGIEAIEILLEAGADMNIKDNTGKTATQAIIRNNQYQKHYTLLAIKTTLVKAGADPDILGDDAGRALVNYFVEANKENKTEKIKETGHKFTRDFFTFFMASQSKKDTILWIKHHYLADKDMLENLMSSNIDFHALTWIFSYLEKNKLLNKDNFKILIDANLNPDKTRTLKNILEEIHTIPELLNINTLSYLAGSSEDDLLLFEKCAMYGLLNLDNFNMLLKTNENIKINIEKAVDSLANSYDSNICTKETFGRLLKILENEAEIKPDEPSPITRILGILESNQKLLTTSNFNTLESLKEKTFELAKNLEDIIEKKEELSQEKFDSLVKKLLEPEVAIEEPVSLSEKTLKDTLEPNIEKSIESEVIIEEQINLTENKSLNYTSAATSIDVDPENNTQNKNLTKLHEAGESLLEITEQINPKNLSKSERKDCKEILTHSRIILENPKNKNSLLALCKLSKKSSEKLSFFWKTIAGPLIAFTGCALVAAGVLGSIPSAGASLSLIIAGSTLISGGTLITYSNHKRKTYQPFKGIDSNEENSHMHPPTNGKKYK